MNYLAKSRKFRINLSLIATLLATMIATQSNATHLVGGEITYEWVTGNTYQVTTKIYRDCAGIAGPTGITMFAQSTNCGQTYSFTLPLSTSVFLPTICAAQDSLSSCNGGMLYGVEQLTYTDTTTLPMNCDDWEISWSSCCRNNAITNLQNSGSTSFYLAATLDNLNHPFNNSVQFGSVPVNVIPPSVTSVLNWNAFDVDGDSLIFELVAPRSGTAPGSPSPVIYNAGHTFQQPFLNSQPTSLNYGNGLLSVTPNAQQVCAVAMKVSEYRNGSLIGEVYRDLQVLVTADANNTPTLTGIDGTTNFVISGCPGDTITFFVNSNDVDTGQVVSIGMGGNATGGSFNISGSPYPTGTYTWVPDTNDISASPYIVTLNVADDHCPYVGTNTYAYYVFVNACSTNDVWPGDANWDGTANLYDLLPVGIAFNETGAVRPNASLAWVAQPSGPDWASSFLSGLNYKHADTNGDGVVNFSDTSAIAQNFGLTHPLRNSPPPSTASANLSIIASQDTVATSTPVDLTVMLDSPADSIYGIAFRLNFTPGLILPGSVTIDHSASLFGTAGVDMMEMHVIQGGMGYVDIAITGIDQLNRNANGPIVVMSIVTTDNVSGKTTFDVFASDIEAIYKNGDPLAIVPAGSSVTVDPNLTSVFETNPEQFFQVYMNNENILTYNYSGKGAVEQLEVTDMQGRVVLSEMTNSNNGEFLLNSFSSGIYTVRSYINGIPVVKKIRVF